MHAITVKINEWKIRNIAGNFKNFQMLKLAGNFAAIAEHLKNPIIETGNESKE